ncbi:amidase family protein, partial [Pseudomonas viridiflava]|uniref:amidase family protein n=1 Tax=Pseudomonas viridiflava TaxID=33069 RepID=UPI001F121C37
IILGHTICSELSTHTVGQFAGYAWDPERVPGGSSQGSGVAPMARLCAAALGEETAGSIIIPAAANGASAIKPSLGLVSGAGVMPLRTGWDVVGPMARS